MAVLVLSPSRAVTGWAEALRHAMPGEDIRVNTPPGAPPGTDDDVDVAVVWKPPAGRLAQIPNLGAVFSIGAGVDHVFADPELPAGIPIARLVDPMLTSQMTEYVVMNVLWQHREMDAYAALQREEAWRHMHPPRTEDRRIGIMGLGVLGAAAGEALARFGFPLAAWTRRARDWALGTVFHGPAGLAPFLAQTDILVCLLPLTPETRGILNAAAFAMLPDGAAVINAARGGHVVEKDLIAALDAGTLASATLDVFDDEPLPAGHPFWRHPRVRVTPHVATLTYPDDAAREIARNIARFRAGEPLAGLVDPSTQY